MKKEDTNSIAVGNIADKIYWIRGERVMLDRDLASLYGVETRTVNQAVKRNPERFPDDFMFRLTDAETKNITSLRSQFVTLKRGQHSKYQAYAFTEQGVAMLSSVLKSKRAIQVNISIMRIFTKMRGMLLAHKELREKIERMERRYDKQFRVIFDVMKKLLDDTPPVPRRKIGFDGERKRVGEK